jgi:nucleotide-binding universal stress UspA family protein
MKILLPIDASPCAAAAVDTVVSRFKSEHTEVRVLHVVEWPKDLPMFLAYGEGPTAADDLIASRHKAVADGEALTANAVGRLRAAGFGAHADVRSGAARDAILACAAEWRPDVIVIGSHGRRGLDRLLLGSVAEYIMRHATSAVYVVRPDLQPAPAEAAGQQHVSRT